MDNYGSIPSMEVPVGSDAISEEDYSYQSRLLQEFTSIPTVDKAWVFTSSQEGSEVRFSISQPHLLTNKNRKYILSSHISTGSTDTLSFKWGSFPIEMTGISIMVPSPSGSRLFVVRNSENDSPTQFEIWGQSQVEKEFQIPQTVHGSVYTDGWFEGISWSSDESFIAYIAEDPAPIKPTFNRFGYKMRDSTDNDCGSWKGLGEWEDDWGEAYAGKRKPALFVIDVFSGEVRAVEGIRKSISAGQVVWAPSTETLQHLVFVGWSSENRKLGIKYCHNRPCALYAVRSPFVKSEIIKAGNNVAEDGSLVRLTNGISSAFFPRFSPDGKFLAFLSAKSSVDSGAHLATNSLHRIDWPSDGKLSSSNNIVDVVPVLMCPEDDGFPGLYCSKVLSKPWLQRGYTMILSSIWCSTQVILAIDILSGNVSRISPSNTIFSWDLLALDDDHVIAVCSSPIDIPEIKYGLKASTDATWSWKDISSPISTCSEKVRSLLSSRQVSIIKVPVRDVSKDLAKGASKPYESIFVSTHDKSDPLIVVLHGGPHDVSSSSFSKSLAFLTSLGFSLLMVNYRGSWGFGEEALQSLPGKIGSQDVNDVLNAIDHVIDTSLAKPSKMAVVGISHGGFLTTHLIGQAPERFAAAAARNPVCNLASMVGTTDIPDWCYVEAFGTEGKSRFTGAPSPDDLAVFHYKSPISHLSEVKTPTIFLLGAQDVRVPVSNGLQYARALKEKGGVVKIMMFPNDIHPINRPQSDFESFLNIGVWFKKYCL